MSVAWGRVALAAAAWAGLAAASPAAVHAGDPDARLRAPGPALRAEAPGPRVVTPYFHDLVLQAPDAEWMDARALEMASLGYPSFNVRARVTSLGVYSAADPTRLAAMLVDGWTHWPLAHRRYAVTHLVLDRPLTRSDRDLRATVTRGAVLEGVSDDHEIWAVPHRPWASFADDVRTVPDERQAVVDASAALRADAPTVVVEAFGAFRAGRGRVLSVARELESVRIEAEAEEEATLVVADAFWPGWEATLDGAPVPVFRADVFVRAVRWPAGRHVLEMRYRPREVRTGLALSLAGLALGAAAMAFLHRRRSGVPRPEAA